MSSEIQPGAAESMATAQLDSEKSIWAIIGGVFMAPTAAFADFKLKPQILVPIILSIVLAGIGAALVAEQAAMLQYDMMKTSTTLPPTALEQMREAAQNSSPLKNGLTGWIGVIGIGLVVALMAWFMGSVIFGKKANFKAVWGVELLAGLIPLVGGLIRAPLVMAKGNMLVSFGLAALLPDKDFTSFVYSVLYFFDAFAIWGIVVAGFGYAAIFGLSNAKGIVISAISSGVLMILFAALGIFGMGLAGVETSFF